MQKSTTAMIITILLVIVAVALTAYYFIQPKAPDYAQEQISTGCHVAGDGCGGLLNGFAKCCSAFKCLSPNFLTGGTCTYLGGR